MGSLEILKAGSAGAASGGYRIRIQIGFPFSISFADFVSTSLKFASLITHMKSAWDLHAVAPTGLHTLPLRPFRSTPPADCCRRQCCHALLLHVARCMLHMARGQLSVASCQLLGLRLRLRLRSHCPKSVHHYVNALNAHVNQDEVPLICGLLLNCSSSSATAAASASDSVFIIIVVAVVLWRRLTQSVGCPHSPAQQQVAA